MTIQHTPLPWTVDERSNTYCFRSNQRTVGWIHFWLTDDYSDAKHISIEEQRANAQFIVTACNWHDEAREALTEIAILCEADTDKTNWQDILRRANSALEHLARAENKQ